MSRVAHNINGLTPLEQAFCDALLLDPERNAMRAMLSVRPKYSKPNASVAASRMLTRPRVRGYMDAREADIRARAEREQGIEQRKVLEVLADMMLFDVEEVFDAATGRVRSVREMPRRLRRAISGFDLDVVTGANGEIVKETRKVRFWSRGDALDRAMRHLGLFAKDNEQRRTVDEISREIERKLAQLGV